MATIKEQVAKNQQTMASVMSGAGSSSGSASKQSLTPTKRVYNPTPMSMKEQAKQIKNSPTIPIEFKSRAEAKQFKSTYGYKPSNSRVVAPMGAKTKLKNIPAGAQRQAARKKMKSGLMPTKRQVMGKRG
jgi:hypothetical protein